MALRFSNVTTSPLAEIGQESGMLRICIRIVLVLAMLGGLAPAGGQTNAVDPKAPGNGQDQAQEPTVYCFLDAQYVRNTARSPCGQLQEWTEATIRVSPVAARSSVLSLIVAQREEVELVRGLKRGDYVSLRAKQSILGSTWALDFAKYDLHPGEEVPNVFLFAGADDAGAKGTIVHLSKMGQRGDALIAPDKTVLAATISRLKVGDVIEVLGPSSGHTLQAAELGIYFAPATGTITAIGEEVVAGGKTPQVTVKTNEGAKALLVFGKADGAGVFSPDTRLAAKVKTYKVGDAAKVTYRSDGEKLWLKAIESAGK